MKGLNGLKFMKGGNIERDERNENYENYERQE